MITSGARRESRGLILRLALRAIRWRAATSATVFVVAVVAILAATVGPIYLSAVDEAVLAAHLTRASLFQRDVSISRSTQPGYAGTDWGGQVRRLAAEVARDRLFAAPVMEEQVDVDYGGTPPAFKDELAAVDDLCLHVRIVRGRCLSGDSTSAAVISTNTARAEHLTVGGTLAATAPNGVTIRLRVAGVYRPLAPGGAFWEPWDLFGAGQPASGNGLAPADALFVTPAALSSRVQRVPETLSANVALVPRRVGHGDVGELSTTIAQVRATVGRLSTPYGAPPATVTTFLPAILGETGNETSLARTLVTVATVQLALLAIFLLYAVVANTTSAQGPEVALAKLRGRRARSVLLQGVAQPVALVVLAAPVAALLAWVLVRLLAGRLLGRPVDVAFPPAAYGVAALAVLGGVLAAIVAAYRIVTTPVGALMRLGAATPGSAVGLLLADAAAVTIAVAGLIELEAGGVLRSGRANPLAMLAPTLLALAGAVVTLRLLPLLARPLARWTRDSRHLATFLVVRRLMRRPAEARAVLLVAVAVSIAAFALATWASAGHNRELRALDLAGADTVLIVRPGAAVHDLRTAVDRADPGGHSMAVAYSSVDEPPLLAVDTTRFAGVGAWVAGNTPAPLRYVLHRLAGSRPPPVIVRGTRLRLRIALGRHLPRPVHLALTVGEPNFDQATRTIAPVRPGAGSYELSLPATCAAGCRVDALGLTANTSAYSNQVSAIDAVIGAWVRGGDGWRPVASFGDPARWRGDGKGPVTIASAGASLSLDVRQTSGSAAWPSAVSAAVPAILPGIVASGTAALYEGEQIHSVTAVGLDGETTNVDGVFRSLTLPRIDRNGMMVDFGSALAAMAGAAAPTTQYQVWLSASAPANMAARLARQHVYVTRTIHASTLRASVDASGPAFADSLFLIAALAAIVLAVGATAVGRVVSVRRRGYELAALEAVGVAPRTLRRATAAEQGSIFAIGLCVGLAAGLLGSRLALPSMPIFVDTSTGPPLVFALPWALLGALAAGLLVVFAAVSVAMARLVERAATPSQLRGGQQ